MAECDVNKTAAQMLQISIGFGAGKAQTMAGQKDGHMQERNMAKGMNKQGKNVKKPKKEVAKAPLATPSTKGSVSINGGTTKS
jgi:hypothetical protein